MNDEKNNVYEGLMWAIGQGPRPEGIHSNIPGDYSPRSMLLAWVVGLLVVAGCLYIGWTHGSWLLGWVGD